MEEQIELLQFNLDIVYYMLAIGLVFFMQAGFAMLESGMTGSRSSANIMMKNLADASFGILAYFLVGFGIMYGASLGGLFGTDTFALGAGSYTDGLAAEPFLAVDFLYQAVFAATAATIVSGAIAGRMKFGGYVILSVLMTTLIYPVVGHWNWGGGWLGELGFTDFAGSTIVHLTGGVAGLTAAAILGPRLGKFGKDGKPRAIPGHSASLATLGCFILFLGWFGFNGGSVLEADGALIAPVLLTTMLAAVAGGASAMVYTWVTAKPDLGMTINGILAGLVGITAGADSVGPVAAIGVGLVAGPLVAISVSMVEKAGWDDAVGAFSVHGTCGALGTLWVGAYANIDEATGFWHGGGFGLFGVQLVGVVAVTVFVTVTVGIIATILKGVGLLRVPAEVEHDGLDMHEHGAFGYPEFTVIGASYPSGESGEADSTRVVDRPAEERSSS